MNSPISREAAPPNLATSSDWLTTSAIPTETPITVQAGTVTSGVRPAAKRIPPTMASTPAETSSTGRPNRRRAGSVNSPTIRPPVARAVRCRLITVWDNPNSAWR